MPKIKAICAVLAFVATSIVATSAQATLVGDTIFASGTYVSSPSATIGSGIEFTGIAGYLNFDFGVSSLTITPNANVLWSGFGSYVFSGFDDTITSFTLASNSGFSGGVVSNYSFSGHTLTLDMDSGSSGGRSTAVVFSINANSVRATSAVPEPSSLALLGAGLILAVLNRKKRQGG
jgi:hypothetical protein